MSSLSLARSAAGELSFSIDVDRGSTLLSYLSGDDDDDYWY